MSTEAPSGIKLRFSDGSVVDCTVERAPEYDQQRRQGTIEYYTARPVRDVSPDLTYEVEIGRHPAMTGIHLDLGTAERSLLDWVQPKN